MTSSPSIGIRFEIQGVAGLITLDRPKALNALDHDMIRAMAAQLDAWAADDIVRLVILRSASERAFCVGGDVRAMHDLGRAEQIEQARDFWRDEYALNLQISRYAKPFVALVDGLCFGGGFGISGHARYRVAGERLGFAMPEVAIGLFPDVGGTYVLPRLPGWHGTWLAMTGARIGMPDAMALGLYTHHVPAARWPELTDRLARGGGVEATLARFAAASPPPPLAPYAALIDRVFAGGSVMAVVAALEHAAGQGGTDAEFARAQLDTIRRGSPTSVHIAFEQMRRGLRHDLAGCLVLEFRMVTRLLYQHDFYEGVRAVLVDKDGRPEWWPARLEDIDPAQIAAMFDEPLPDDLMLT